MIALVRHPPVDAAGRCYGRMDVPLAHPAAAVELAGRLARLGGRIWTSPALRCRSVAEALGDYSVDDRLAELDFGAWEGRLWDDVPRAALDAWASDPWGFAPPKGETGAALVSRIRNFHAELLSGDHVVISHGGPLKVLMALVEGKEIDLFAPPPAPGSVTVLAGPELPLPLAGEGRGEGGGAPKETAYQLAISPRLDHPHPALSRQRERD